jgi:hypothetical protein
MKRILSTLLFPKIKHYLKRTLSLQHINKIHSSMNNLDDGGDKNPPKGKSEKSHKLQVKIKRTNVD